MANGLSLVIQTSDLQQAGQRKKSHVMFNDTDLMKCRGAISSIERRLYQGSDFQVMTPHERTELRSELRKLRHQLDLIQIQIREASQSKLKFQ